MYRQGKEEKREHKKDRNESQREINNKARNEISLSLIISSSPIKSDRRIGTQFGPRQPQVRRSRWWQHMTSRQHVATCINWMTKSPFGGSSHLSEGRASTPKQRGTSPEHNIESCPWDFSLMITLWFAIVVTAVNYAEVGTISGTETFGENPDFFSLPSIYCTS